MSSARQSKSSPSGVGRALRRVRTTLADAGAATLEFVGGNVLLLSFLALGLVLIALFFIGLRWLQPSTPGTQVRLSRATQLIDRGHVRQAVLWDQDKRLQLVTRTGIPVWASYPNSDAYTGQLLDSLTKAHVPTEVDNQTWKWTLRAVIQFLLPILILVSFFAFFTTLAREKGGGAIAAFSR